MEDTRVPARELIRAGFVDLDRAREMFAHLNEYGVTGYYRAELLEAFSKAYDTDTALRHATELARRVHDEGRELETLFAGLDGLSRLIAVFGASDEMGRLMQSRPALIDAVTGQGYESHLWNRDQRRTVMLERIGADPTDDVPVADKPLAEAATELRRCYREQLAAIMAKDVTAEDSVTV